MALLFIAALALVGGYRQLALRRRWFDMPNARSSHVRPVPRGAGIVLAGLLALAVLVQGWSGRVPPALAWTLAPAFGVALVGWWDDLRGVSAQLRFALYGLCCASSAIALCLAHGAPSGVLPALAVLLAVGAALWVVNLYNFMDGINGIAAIEGLFIAAGALWLGAGAAAPPLQALAALLLGFLPWNFPRARVFMGDAGSAFLGAVLAAVAAWSILGGSLSLWQWLILGGTFVVDATLTLLTRIATGQRWHQAHRSHAYQHLADALGSHAGAVSAYLAVNSLWLLPWAWVASAFPGRGWLCVLLAYLPLACAGVYLRAGRPLSPLRRDERTAQPDRPAA